ncbi:uncharacterized protein DEA37_0012200 [Paragonimus westermani]|uniref:Uncharacterized protein n=1 Tax=Paragonimus westermani TaxID=34504 RepID=A0A5J4NLS2_9TREM|nr:uncharacterized protein DEA37_0012200 [Paragonimus westermani]
MVSKATGASSDQCSVQMSVSVSSRAQTPKYCVGFSDKVTFVPSAFWIQNNWCRDQDTGMKIPSPQPFEDGDVRSFPEDFEDVAEAVGVKADRAKLAVLRMLFKGRAKAVLDAARRSPAKLDPADCQEAMRRFKGARLGPGGDALVYAMSLWAALSRALSQLDQDSEQRLLTAQFLDGVPPTVRDQLRVALITQPMTLEHWHVRGPLSPERRREIVLHYRTVNPS